MKTITKENNLLLVHKKVSQKSRHREWDREKAIKWAAAEVDWDWGRKKRRTTNMVLKIIIIRVHRFKNIMDKSRAQLRRLALYKSLIIRWKHPSNLPTKCKDREWLVRCIKAQLSCNKTYRMFRIVARNRLCKPHKQ